MFLLFLNVSYMYEYIHSSEKYFEWNSFSFSFLTCLFHILTLVSLQVFSHHWAWFAVAITFFVETEIDPVPRKVYICVCSLRQRKREAPLIPLRFSSGMLQLIVIIQFSRIILPFLHHIGECSHLWEMHSILKDVKGFGEMVGANGPPKANQDPWWPISPRFINVPKCLLGHCWLNGLLL